MGKTLFDDGSTLKDMLDQHIFPAVEPGKPRKETIRLRPARWIPPPDTFYLPAGRLQTIECVLSVRNARMISGNVRIEPGAFRPPVIYTNVVTGTVDRFSLDQLPLDTGPVAPGSFYFLLHPLRYYHCARVHEGIATWDLIESFQNGVKTSGSYEQSTDYAAHYIPVTDKAIIRRLEWRLENYEAVRTGGAPVIAEPPQFARRRWRLPWRRSDDIG